MMADKKRGQFYLIAAIIIIVALISIATVTNYVLTEGEEESIKLYELSKELQLEGENVIDYGIYQGNIDEILAVFTDKYADYIFDEDTNIYFIYGDEEKAQIYGRTSTELGGITLNVGESQVTYVISGTEISSEKINIEYGQNVAVEVDDITYTFNIKKGENFFFVIEEPIE